MQNIIYLKIQDMAFRGFRCQSNSRCSSSVIYTVYIVRDIHQFASDRGMRLNQRKVKKYFLILYNIVLLFNLDFVLMTAVMNLYRPLISFWVLILVVTLLDSQCNYIDIRKHLNDYILFTS